MSNPWTWYFNVVQDNYYRKVGNEIPEHYLKQLKWFVGLASVVIVLCLILSMVMVLL